jgi:hypothetical protein
MVRSLPTALVATFAVLASVSGCDCRGQSVKQSLGELGIIWRDAENNRQTNRDATYDFGLVLDGQGTEMSLTVRNSGAGKLTLMRLEKTQGDEVVIGAATDDSVFDVAFVEGVTLEPSSQTDFAMHFKPRGLKGRYEAKLLLISEGARPEDSTAVITLKGQGEMGSCDLPDLIDFGQVSLGEIFPYTVPYVNPTGLPGTGLAGDISGADATSFSYQAGSPKGTIAVPPRTTTNVVLTFSPTEKRVYTAQVPMRGAGACPEKVVTLRGEGSDQMLTWTPNSLSYGFVNPGAEALQDVVFVNPAAAPVTLSMIATSDTANFYHAVTAGQDATRFTVPGNSVPTPMKIACNPATLGRHQGTLTFSTGLQRVTGGSITLDCIGGGPRIKVTPKPNLAFGRVGFFPGSTTFNVTRKVNVQNVGTQPPVADPKANLYLGQVLGGMAGNLPLFEVSQKNPATDPTEFVVSLGSAYPSATGLEAVSGKNAVDLLVTLTPKSTGAKEAELKLYSNDPAEPVVTLTLTADVQQLPPCNYKATPAMANFGLVTPGTTKDLPIIITNLGTAQDTCYLSGIDLAAGSNAAYSIVGGPIVEKELRAGQSLQVVVRVAPTGVVPTSLVTLAGNLTFNATNPLAPQGVVPLRTSVGPSCLAVTPDPLDFGTVRLGCNSSARTFNIYNVCTANVTVQSFSMQAGAGQPFGGPNCLTTAAGCPEFFLTMAPAIPTGGLTITPGAAPVTFQAKYKPIDISSDSGAVAINAVQDGQSVTYLVGLTGNGDSLGQQTDTFMQDLQPKADILLVIDDSGSMQDKQTSLANNFASFIQYAVAANVDYHLGVTTTTLQKEECFGSQCFPVNSKSPAGELYRDTVLGVRYITPATPAVASVFSRIVNVGTQGSGYEQALETSVLALTPPKITNENAGFLRPDANLAVVLVTDAGDQSPQPVSYYQNRLINVKGFNRLSMFTFNVIGPWLATSPLGCTYDGDHDPARYQPIITATSGVSDEICNTNWASALQNLGRTAFGYRTQFYLNSTPDQTGGHTIEVKVNGVAIPSGATTWSYDPASNTIKFLPTATPGPGQKLEVGYTTACF